MVSTWYRRRCLAPMSTIAACLIAGPAWSVTDVSLSKSVSPAVIATGMSVEFEIVVTNAGPDIAREVVVRDQLPVELRIPAGTAVAVSQGSYDPASGDWRVGDLPADTVATMTIPAELADDATTPCIVNTASLQTLADDTDTDNDVARATVRLSGIERCVDLAADNPLLSIPQPVCSAITSATYTVLVRNDGPDEARNVTVEVTQSPEQLPNFAFAGGGCTAPSTRCEIGALAAGDERLLTLTSAGFTNESAYELDITVQVSSTDEEADLDDNGLISMHVVPITTQSSCDIDLPRGTGAASCFIATAAWGSARHDDVTTLREFRDRHLLTNRPGRAFVDLYYRLSPPVAASIAHRPWLRAATRAALAPVVFAIRHPIPTGLAAVLAGLLLVHSAARRESAT